ncbi:tetratricopeptide repeat protein [Streptomyces sp. SID14478]|uniref:ATP-binding protein n=1 Tax=Streptomyces sp. SID14478 TaxID=2706073 RepID=UPI0013D99D6F|nr:NB-ARC domain-containing protein [Streptomyces sp. SID14478]NEB74755.1 tetratricopeptide repeat protein [Streptomyces sp. SID14478]
MAVMVPDETTSFVGRGNESRQVVGMLATHRVVTLVGAGGVGKTRLAVRGALQDEGRHPDGVYWVDLTPLVGDRLLIATVCDVVGLADHTPRMQIDVLRSWLADRRVLLVLDSCEHLVPDLRRMLDDLLAYAPGLTVLATSRKPLEVAGEQTVRVDPLPVDEGTPGEDSDALRLFRDRARPVVAPHVLDSPEWTAAASDVCRRLEGVPLALELACAQLRSRSIADLADALASRLEALTGDPTARPARHRALRTTIGWSHELCSPVERLVWARLSVARCPVDLQAAQAICALHPLGPDEVAAALDSLVNQSVLTRVGDRFRMLDTLKEYGRMWLAELGEEERIARAHASHHLHVARTAAAEWAGPKQVQWYQRIARTHPDLCAAIDHLLLVRPEEGLELAGHVAFYWTCCGHLHEARGYLERGLALHHAHGPVRAQALWGLGVACLLQGEHDTAQALAADCAREAEEFGDHEARLAAAYLNGLIYLLTGRPLVARTTAERALDAEARGTSTSPGRLRCRLIGVFALTALGAHHESQALARELLAECEAADELWTRSYLQYQLSLIALFEDRVQDAEEHARAMLHSKWSIGDSFGIALGLDLLAAALAAQGQSEDATVLSGTGLAYWRSVGHLQRGTPELAPVREQTERQALTDMGPQAYKIALQRGEEDTERGLALAFGNAPDRAPE